MIGRQDRWQEDLFVAGPLRDLIPEDHVLKRVDTILNLSWLVEEVGDTYCSDLGRRSIDPESALRLMLAGFFQGIVHDRRLMQEAKVNLAIRWFAGYRLHEELPDHSSLTRIRQRWGAERFKRIFARTVAACKAAGLVNGQTVHVDATLIRADVSWESLTTKHVTQVLEANADTEEASEEATRKRRGRPRTRPPKEKKTSRTDPDATLTTSNNAYRMEPSFKQHTAVDDQAGIIVDVAVTTGEVSEGQQLIEQIGRIEAQTGMAIHTLTADAAYAHGMNYQTLEARHIDAVIPPQTQPRRPKHIPVRRFKYDACQQTVRCPRGKTLRRTSRNTQPSGWVYKARRIDCANCPLRRHCFSGKSHARTVVIVDGYEALLRARRRKAQGWDKPTRAIYNRHRWRVEGVHGIAKTQHRLGRAIRRGLANVAIQVYLTAAVMNLKRLARAIGPRLRSIGLHFARTSRFRMPVIEVSRYFSPNRPVTFRPCHIA